MVCPLLRITGVAKAFATLCGVPNLYTTPRTVNFEVTTIGFNCETHNYYTTRTGI